MLLTIEFQNRFIIQMKKYHQDQTQGRKCQKCNNILEANEKTDQITCKHCGHINLQELRFSTPELREEQCEQMMEKVNVLRFKKSLSLQPMDKIEDLQEQQPLNALIRPESVHEAEMQLQDSDDEEDQRLKMKENQLRQAIKAHNHDLNAEKKIIIGSGFTFDMTDFFKFKRKELAQGEAESFFQTISGSRIAWVILLYTVCSSALVPGWIMNIKANKFLRQVWRFLMQALMVIPFVLYEKRTISEENKEKYTLRYILQPQNIIKPYISSLSASLFFLFVLTSFEWTYVSHGIVLGGLSNFFLSISRSLNKNSHDLESGGQVLVIIGVGLVIHSTLSVNPQTVSMDVYGYLNYFYLKRTWWQRLGGDFLGIMTSLMMAQFSKFTSDLRNYYPPFLSMLLVNIFNVINMTLISFFCNGASFDYDPFWGIFSVFRDSHFISFMYMAIVLAFGQMVSVVLITKMFPDPIIPALAMTLEPFIASFFVDIAKIQGLPSNFSMVGFIFILPGIIMVLMGQCFFQRQKSYQQQSDKRVRNLLQQIKTLKDTIAERQTHVQLKQQKILQSATLRLTQSQHGYSRLNNA